MKYTGKAFKLAFTETPEDLPIGIVKGEPFYTSFWLALKYMNLKQRRSGSGSGEPFLYFFEAKDLDAVPVGLGNYVLASKKTLDLEGSWRPFLLTYYFSEENLWIMGEEYPLDEIPVFAHEILGPTFIDELEKHYETMFQATATELISAGFLCVDGRWMYEPKPDSTAYGEGMAILNHKTFTYRRALELFVQAGRKNPKEVEEVARWIGNL